MESPFNQDCEWTAVPFNLRSTATGLSHKAYKVILSGGSWINLQEVIYYEASALQASSTSLPRRLVAESVDSTRRLFGNVSNRVVEPVELVLLHVHYKASLPGLSTRASLLGHQGDSMVMSPIN